MKPYLEALAYVALTLVWVELFISVPNLIISYYYFVGYSPNGYGYVGNVL